MDVLCIGHASWDISVFSDGYPRENTKSETQHLIEAGGGPAANAAWLLSYWGERCALAALLGDDDYGRRIVEEFRAVGAELSMIELRSGHSTPVSVLLINLENGSRTIVNRKIQGPTLGAPPAGFTGMKPRVLLFDGHEPSASLAALEAFPAAYSILDAGSWREGTAVLAGKVDCLAASERFATQATGMPNVRDPEAARECVRLLRERFGTTVVVTLGEEGLVADDGAGFLQLPAFPAKAVDTTTAGDIFHGALAWAALHELAFREGLRFASMAASLSVRSMGGRGSTPKLEQLREALAHAG